VGPTAHRGRPRSRRSRCRWCGRLGGVLESSSTRVRPDESTRRSWRCSRPRCRQAAGAGAGAGAGRVRHGHGITPFASHGTTGTICASPGAGFGRAGGPHCCCPPNSLTTQSAHHPHRGGLLLPAVRAGGSGPSFLQLRCPTELLLGRHSPRKLRAATAGRPSCECHISRHRDRRRHMAKPCCDHRDRTLCRCIDLPHVCQYPRRDWPDPNAVPSCICPAAGPRNNHGFAGGNTPPDKRRPSHSPVPATRKSWGRPATTRPQPSNHDQRPWLGRSSEASESAACSFGVPFGSVRVRCLQGNQRRCRGGLQRLCRGGLAMSIVIIDNYESFYLQHSSNLSRALLVLTSR